MYNPVPTLPPNTTPLERAMARACAALADTPAPIRDLWNADRCPVDLLPFLAWSFSVDRWDDTWPESIKRGTIKAARYIHQHKGTIAAVRGVVESLGYIIKIREWWQTEPRGQRGTFALEVGVLDAGITDEMFLEMERLIDDAKPLSRHLTGLRIHLEVRGSLFVGTFIQLGETVTVYPWTPDSIETTGGPFIGCAAHFIETMTIYP
ncbi:bacteriophage P2-related tail formation protein [Herbaspirillum rubrisubalbicans M1]|uniref:phage tail protein I n=1 Tax=Herbaspirillum rubrisubalbicans TaxID=80842 RepID=UPI00073AA7E7|nr:phage tail protein I [Herbaspirillum rubrisubalbicans]ALU88619.1 bacteriophage P2-related tail formation protein [Herbaspirillum rubrisubalbicans M1]